MLMETRQAKRVSSQGNVAVDISGNTPHFDLSRWIDETAVEIESGSMRRPVEPVRIDSRAVAKSLLGL